MTLPIPGKNSRRLARQESSGTRQPNHPSRSIYCDRSLESLLQAIEIYRKTNLNWRFLKCQFFEKNRAFLKTPNHDFQVFSIEFRDHFGPKIAPTLADGPIRGRPARNPAYPCLRISLCMLAICPPSPCPTDDQCRALPSQSPETTGSWHTGQRGVSPRCCQLM